MVQAVKCIALRTVKVADSRNLLSVWTAGEGRLSFAVAAGHGREAARRRALLSPLATFEAVADIRPQRTIHTLRDVAPLPHSLAFAASPVKTANAQFLADALDVLLRQSPPDTELSDFLFDAVALFADAEGHATANFNASFFYHLTYFLGISPNLEGEGSVFDLRSGSLAPAPPLHPDYVAGDDCAALRALARVPLRHCGMLRIPRADRARALDTILRYYSIHIAPLDSLASLAIVKSLFA